MRKQVSLLLHQRAECESIVVASSGTVAASFSAAAIGPTPPWRASALALFQTDTQNGSRKTPYLTILNRLSEPGSRGTI